MSAPAKVTFYELNEQRDVLDQFLLEHEGEETPEIKELWEALSGDAENKALNWARWNKERALDVKIIDGMLGALRAQVDQLLQSRKAIEAEVERSRRELSRNMLHFGLEKVKAPGVSVWHVDEKPDVVTPDLATVAPEWRESAVDDGWLSYVPAHQVAVPERYEWNVEQLIEWAQERELAEQGGTLPIGPLPEGVTVTFKKGIRIR